MKKLGFLFDQNFCIGCKACEIACQVYHNQDPDINWRHVDRIKIHEDGIAKDMYLSRSCHHCDNPTCLHVCPVGAYKKLDNGVVEPIHDRCIGCGYCILACPYSAITKGKDKKAQKCNLCSEKLQRGEEPACVECCPVGVLKLVPSDLSDSAGMQKEMVGFVHSFTKPNIRFYPKIKSANFTK